MFLYQRPSVTSCPSMQCVNSIQANDSLLDTQLDNNEK